MNREYTSSGWIDRDNNLANHYGVLLNTNEPTTGVYQNNNIDWLHDETIDGIDLLFEDHINSCELCETGDWCEWSEYYDDSGDILIGDWILDTKTGLYEPNKESEYSAIVGEIYTQVVWSKHTSSGALCSPCYPGQVDVDTPGEFLHYAMPPEILGDL